MKAKTPAKKKLIGADLDPEILKVVGDQYTAIAEAVGSLSTKIAALREDVARLDQGGDFTAEDMIAIVRAIDAEE